MAASPIEMKSSVSAHDKKTVMTKFIIAGLRMDQAGTTVPLIHWSVTALSKRLELIFDYFL